ncbi:helix-turn-helix transcriptional regulator [Burkholderia cenocepacia]|uniref:helix-turn-helix transcriptional regulator n=1 Tax=Burkholderia cenocepacia TaxID=95486 RepID=UPI000D00C2CF|nr:AlpA family phage regulatory protein [Burkholderia cenocepacia]PRE35805.1 AlpA family transcriptional regulator [Burkholderia cenocepacia]
MAPSIQLALTILRRKQVEAVTGLSRSTIYDRIRVKTFPPPVRLGAKSVGWRAGDIDAFLADPAGYRAPEAAA